MKQTTMLTGSKGDGMSSWFRHLRAVQLFAFVFAGRFYAMLVLEGGRTDLDRERRFSALKVTARQQNDFETPLDKIGKKRPRS